MSRDESLRRPAQRPIDYAVQIQDSLGGWRYDPGSDSDLSVTGWFMMALQSGRMAGLEVPSPTLLKVAEFLDLVAHDNGARYAYQPGQGPTPAMTAEGLLCRQYLGWPRYEPRLQEGVDYLLANRIDRLDQNVYGWYYATQVLHHMEGDAWDTWNQDMRRIIPELKEGKGKERGSWSPTRVRWGGHGGRLFVTCLATYMHEVYCRHLPIYRQPLAAEE